MHTHPILEEVSGSALGSVHVTQVFREVHEKHSALHWEQESVEERGGVPVYPILHIHPAPAPVLEVGVALVDLQSVQDPVV